MGALPAESIHQRLSDLRNEIGKSQKEVADDLYIQPSVLSRIERGETKAVSHDLIIKLADYYHVSTDYLLCLSDIKLRKNVELEELGLSNNALLFLLQGNVDGKMLSQMIEHPYFPVLLDTANAYFSEAHNAGFATRNEIIDMGTVSIKEHVKNHPEDKTEGQHDIRGLNAQKITGAEADIEKIKNIFLSMLKDIKKDYDIPKEDASSAELKKQIATMKKQALVKKKKKSNFNEMDMTQIIMGMFGNIDLDEYEKQKFQELTVHLLKRKNKKV